MEKEMEQKLAKENSPMKRDGRILTRCPNLKILRSLRAAEAIEQVHGGKVVARDDENGVVRVKIVVTKQQLRQMVASRGRGRSNAGHRPLAAPAPDVEQLMHVLRRRHMKRAEAERGCRSGWRPKLQSIPEEN
ncbi:uncharacterized protein LOC120110749 [Phoenix dactylifera]|uniref:Uncharacterized protein LOC103703826 n=1 Tax=Phoenix dactylifera TaxID=42345 RepID=A0A8B7BTI4_PHODC|nr:uncharacterized protein LOC103703826 [Phoenix dactylifera]XP_038982233.1 uncharacterized protein LOC120110749 [Phoenix dactylifera]